MVNLHLPTSLRLPALIAGIAAIIFSTVALTKTRLAWHANSASASALQANETSVSGHPVRKARPKPKCNECGVVESMKRVNAAENSPAIYEIKVRMRDGTVQISHDANPANWRRGEHVILVGGNQT